MVVPTSEKGYQVAPSAGWWEAPQEEETPELRWPLSVAVYDRMRRQDAQVISVLRAVTLPIRRTAWRLDPAGARPEVVAMVADDLGLPVVGQEARPVVRTRDRFSWTEHLHLALTKLAFGHAVFEQVYRVEGDRARLRKLAWRPPRTISRVDVAPDGGLVAIEQHGTGSAGRHRMTTDRLVVYTNEREGGNWLGVSLLRPAYKFWLLKDRLLRVQALTVDRNGLGVPVYEGAEIPDTVIGEDRVRRERDDLDAGLDIARGLRAGENSGAAIPHGAKLTLQGVTGNLPDAEKPIRYYDEQIARAVLAHFLNLGTQTGSWALGSTFADFFTQSLQSVALAIADTATQHVVEDLVDLNWGPNEPAPRVTFDEIGSKHPATAEAIRALIQCGALTPDAQLEQFLRTTYGLPAADPGTARPTEREGALGEALEAAIRDQVHQAIRTAALAAESDHDEGNDPR